MDLKMQNRIDGYFEKLTQFINRLPLSDRDKNYLWLICFCQFYDEPILSENGKITNGIQTEWQLKRFIEQFKKNFQKSRLKAVEKWTEELNNIKPTEAVSKIDKQLYQLRKKELLAEIGGEELTDWEKWMLKYLSNESEHKKRRLLSKPPKQQGKTSYEWQNKPDEELPELYRLMIEQYRLIASETTYEQFKAVFTGQPLDKIKPIRWILAKNLNAYLIEKLIEKKKISKSVNGNIWEIAKYCFCDGSNFGQLAELYKSNKTGKPRKHEQIDMIVDALKAL